MPGFMPREHRVSFASDLQKEKRQDRNADINMFWALLHHCDYMDARLAKAEAALREIADEKLGFANMSVKFQKVARAYFEETKQP